MSDPSKCDGRYPEPPFPIPDELNELRQRLEAAEKERDEAHQALRVQNVDVILASEETRLNREVKRLNSVRLKLEQELTTAQDEAKRLREIIHLRAESAQQAAEAERIAAEKSKRPQPAWVASFYEQARVLREVLEELDNPQPSEAPHD